MFAVKKHIRSFQASNRDDLKSIVNNLTTDKDTIHSYLDVYESLFFPIKYSASRVLEVGVREGGSIDMWSTYFKSATIYGVDNSFDLLKYDFTNKNVKLFNSDAYDYKFVEDTFEDESFDAVIDDGPHTLESMIEFARLYMPILKPGGLLIVEDIQSMDWVQRITDSLPDDLKDNIRIYDRRHIKNRYDDILIVVTKNKASL